jgi:hypothetical protein
MLPMKRYDVSYYTCYYTLLHTITQKARNIDTLAGEVLEPGDQKIQFKTSSEKPCCRIDPSDEIQAILVLGHFFEKSLSKNLC